MQKIREIPWSRIGAESVAIVASILLAFAINAWWEDRLERDLEVQQLSRLRAELEVNVALLDGFGGLERSLESDIGIVEQIEEAQDRGEETVDISASSFRLLARATSVEVETSVFDGLVRSGRIEIVRNEQIVSALASWESSIKDYTDLAAVARTTTETLLLPALHTRADAANILVLIGRSGRPIGSDNPSGDLSSIQLSIDDEIKGLIAQKVAILGTAGRALDDVRTAAQATIDAIDLAERE
jgi:hypothetical protein